jgi:hypothetical protein
MKTKKEIQTVIDDLITYFGNGIVYGYNDRQLEIMAQNQRDWENLPFESDGPTDEFLENVAKEIIAAE